MKEETKTPKLVGNKSSGYNYKYTSLGDLVLAGVELPPMRVAVLIDGEQNPILDKNGNPNHRSCRYTYAGIVEARLQNFIKKLL